MTRKNKGQEAIEFILIAVLVFFGGLFAIMTLGSKLAGFFTTDSSFAQVANQKANVISTNTSPDFQTTLKTEVDNENRTTVSGYEAMKNPDGSVSLNINNQIINLSPEDLQLTDTVFETTGSSGTQLISAIADIIQEYSTGDQDVPVEISFGTGSRAGTINQSSSTYEGTASVNTIVVKSGDNLTIVQKDQTCVNASGNSCSYEGIYTIKGKIGSGNTFYASSTTAKITEGQYAGRTFGGSFQGTVNTSSGLSLSGSYNINNPEMNTPIYKWDIDFSTLKQL